MKRFPKADPKNVSILDGTSDLTGTWAAKEEDRSTDVGSFRAQRLNRIN